MHFLEGFFFYIENLVIYKIRIFENKYNCFENIKGKLGWYFRETRIALFLL